MMKDFNLEFFVLNVASVSAVGVHLTIMDIISGIGVIALAFLNVMKGMKYLKEIKSKKTEQ